MAESSFASRYNLDAIEDAYARWQVDPAAVDESWRLFFEGFELGLQTPALPPPDGRTQTGVVRLIDAYRDLGHFLAHLDPLSEPKTSYPLLELSEFGLDETDLDRTFDTTTSSACRGRRCASCSRPCAKPIAAPSASSTCTSRTRASAAGSRNAWSRAAIGRTSSAGKNCAS